MCRVVQFSGNTSRRSSCVWLSQLNFCPVQGSNLLRNIHTAEKTDEDDLVCSLCTRHFLLLLSCIWLNSLCVIFFSFFDISKWTYYLFSKQYLCSNALDMCSNSRFTPTRITQIERVYVDDIWTKNQHKPHPEFNFFPNGPFQLRIVWRVYIKHFDSDQAYSNLAHLIIL